MNMALSKNIGLCPNCGEEVRFKKLPFMGQLMTCRRCSVQLEVVQKMPVVLRLVTEFREDDIDFFEFDETEASRSHQRNRKGHW